MSTVPTKTLDRVREAWGVIERAEPGDALSVGVALDYVCDALGCERDAAKTELYRHVARVLTETAKEYGDRSAATSLTLYLYAEDVESAKLFMWGYGTRGVWAERAKRLVKLCSWVANTP